MTAPARTVAVGGDTPYTIHIGPGLLGQGALLAGPVRGRHVLLLSDSAVAGCGRHCWPTAPTC